MGTKKSGVDLELMSNRRLKVLFFVAEFYRLQGAQRSLLALLRTLPEEGIEPFVVFPGEGRCTRAYRNAGLNVIVLPAPEELNETGKGLLKISAVIAAKLIVTKVLGYNRQLARLARDLNIDAFHYNTPRSILLGGLGSLLCRRPRLLHVRGQLHVLGRMHRFVSQLIATRMILVSDALLSHIYPVFRRKCQTVHTGIDEFDISNGNESAGASPLQLPDRLDGQLLVCTFGAVCPFKGYHHLIEAARIVNQNNGGPPPIFLAVGELVDQPYYDYLQTLLKKYSMTDFHFLGWQDCVIDYYKAADIVVLPSVEEERLSGEGINILIKGNEGLPRAVLEAMYLGKPVIASSVAGTAEEIVNGKSGLLVRPGDPQQLAKAIHRLLRDSDLRAGMGRNAAARARAEFSKDKMRTATASIIRQLVG